MKFCLSLFMLIALSLLGYSQTCTLSVTISASGTAICSGTNAILTAQPSGGTAPYSYAWSTGETTQAISVNKAGTYTVTVTDNSTCPSQKTSINITSSTTPNAPATGDVAVCQGTSATLTASGSGGSFNWYDANGKYLTSGAIFNTPPINSQTTFLVETIVNGCVSPRSAATVFTYGGPGVGNVGICYGNTATLIANGYNNYSWFDSNGTFITNGASYTTPALTATTTYYVSADINGCTTPRSAVTVFVTPLPQAPTVTTPAPVCTGSSVNLHADAPAGYIDWFDVPTGGTSLITSPDFTTPALSATTTYYAQATNGCISNRTPVTVTVNAIPVAPSVAAVSPVCAGASATLTVTSTGATYTWYARATGGTALATGQTYITNALTRTTTYFVDASNGSCASQRTAVRVPVNPVPDAPAAEDAQVCSGSTATLVATDPGGTYNWYTTATGGTPIFTGDTFITPAITATTVYYVDATSATGCTGARTAVTVSVFPAETAPTASGTTICAGNSATLTASGANNYQWYNAATGGNKLSDAQVFTTPALTVTTTYYIQTTGNCPSARTAVTVTVTPSPSSPVLNGTTSVCTGQAATLNASASGTVNWYDAASGGTLLHTGNVYTTPPLSQSTTYYADNTSGSCTSPRSAITVNNTTGVNPQFQYPYGTVCSGVGNVTPVINNPAGGTFSASPAGLVFANITTGEINVAASANGTYTISFLNNGACPAITTAKFTIGSTNDATFSYNSPFCQGAANPLPVYPGAYSAGTFSPSSSGLIFVDTSTGEIDLTKSVPGTYTITNTIAGAGSCAISTNTATVVINPKVVVDAGPNQQVASGMPVQLAGNVTGGATTGTWSGGAGTFSNPSKLNSVYTPAPGETSVTLTLTSANPAAPCGPQSASMTINFSPNPTAPVAAGQTICAGSTATLSATAPGGNYQWYGVPTGGTAIATGAAFTTPVLSVNTTYYVSTIINGAESSRTAVLVTVSPSPAAPVVNPSGTCTNSKAVLTVNNPVSGYIYEWFSSATSTTAITSGTTFTTRRLITDVTYYVDAVNNGCTSARTAVPVTVSAVPTITSNDSDTGCSGVPLAYTITADDAAATFNWSRAAVAGISNPAVSAQTSNTITETLINTTTAPVDVVYSITASTSGCPAQPFTYTVTIYPTPTVTSAATATICNGTGVNYTITFSAAQTNFTWGRAAVAGLSNMAISGQTAGTIREDLFNTTNAPVNVTYTYNYGTGPCAGTPFNYTVTVNPGVNITSAQTGGACSGVPQNYVIQSNVPSATFNWSRAATPGIQEGAVSNQTSNTISETLTNTGSAPVNVVYTIVPTAFGCQGAAFNYIATVFPIPAQPVANANSPVCINSTIQLRTPTVKGATYTWTGPDNFVSSDQNPDISNLTLAKAGTYTLTVTVNNCASSSSTVNVMVDPAPVANAGPDQTVCISATSVQLDGSITGGTTTGIWTTSGTGQFSPTTATTLKGQYIPSASDKTEGQVTLTLTSTSKDDCAPGSDSMVIFFNTVPATDAGQPQTVCAQTTSVQLAGKLFISGGSTWKSAGDGSFSNPGDLNAKYFPGPNDIASGKITLTLSANNNDPCYVNSSQVIITFNPPPIITLPAVQYVLKGDKTILTPIVNTSVTYLWSPNVGIDNITAANPVITGIRDTMYTLIVTDALGCVSSKSIRIIVSPQIKVSNTFTPNGDGVNDTWDIPGLSAYQNADVSIFNRDGVLLVHSIGYPIPWDGTYGGKPVPSGVYYYKIDLKMNSKVLAGSLTVLR